MRIKRPTKKPSRCAPRASCMGSPVRYLIGMSTEEYVRAYFNANKFFRPATYIINGRRVVA